MYRSSDEYEEIAKTIIDIYIDYNIKELPVDAVRICKKLGASLLPYSSFERKTDMELLMKKSKYGFFVRGAEQMLPTIYYNDIGTTEEQKRFNIFHEIKHYVLEDDNDDKDDLADFFSKYFMCPVPYLMLKKIDTVNEIASTCGVTIQTATYVKSNIDNRRAKYGNYIFEYEEKLIEQLEPILLKLYRSK